MAYNCATYCCSRSALVSGPGRGTASCDEDHCAMANHLATNLTEQQHGSRILISRGHARAAPTSMRGGFRPQAYKQPTHTTAGVACVLCPFARVSAGPPGWLSPQVRKFRRACCVGAPALACAGCGIGRVVLACRVGPCRVGLCQVGPCRVGLCFANKALLPIQQPPGLLAVSSRHVTPSRDGPPTHSAIGPARG